MRRLILLALVLTPCVAHAGQPEQAVEVEASAPALAAALATKGFPSGQPSAESPRAVVPADALAPVAMGKPVDDPVAY